MLSTITIVVNKKKKEAKKKNLTTTIAYYFFYLKFVILLSKGWGEAYDDEDRESKDQVSCELFENKSKYFLYGT